MNILQTQIQGAPKFLLGNRGFFFEPQDDGRQQGGAPSQGNGNNPGQQQQQSSAPAQVADPFADMDLDLLPDDVRTRIESARQTFATVARQASTAREFQSRYDQTQAQLQQVQQQIQRGELIQRGQQQQPPGQQAEPTTTEGKLERYYIQQGIEPKAAKDFAKLNAGAFSVFANEFSGHIQQQFAPIAGKVVEDSATNVFGELQQSDSLGALRIPEVAQQLWDKTQQMVQAGEVVNRDIAQNLLRIIWARHVEEHGMPDTQTQQQPQPHQFLAMPNIQNNPALTPPTPPNQQTRFSYPGSGAHSRPPITRGASPLDADTNAALAATIDHWQVKPKAFKPK